MGNIVTIAYKELRSYFVSWMAYAVMAGYLGITGFFFYAITISFQEDVRIEYLYGNMSVTLLFVIPLLTMRLFAEEKSTGTLEVLMTSPVTDTQVVIGKFISAFSLANVMLVLSCLFPLILGYHLKVFEMAGIKVIGLLVGPLVAMCLGIWFDMTDNELPGWLKWLVGFPVFFVGSLAICLFFIAHGNVSLIPKEASWVACGVAGVFWLAMLALPRVRDNEVVRLGLAPVGLLLYNIAVPLVLNQGTGDMASTIGGYIGLLLVAACFVAWGVFASSLTDSQVVAGFLAFGVLLVLWVIGWIKDKLEGLWADIIGYVSVLEHFEDFPKGIIDTQHIVYYISFVVLCLFFTVRSVESRKWR